MKVIDRQLQFNGVAMPLEICLIGCAWSPLGGATIYKV